MNQNRTFISYPEPFRAEYLAEDPAPLFRKHFTVSSGLQKAIMRYCPLGLGLAIINDVSATDNLFLTPASDYNKTVWYTEHDVTENIEEGDNLIAVALGNGFFNECLKTSWDFDVAPWRDVPKLWLELELVYEDHTDIFTTDTSWVCEKERSPYRFNQYRTGEIYDANYMTMWWSTELDDSDWRPAIEAVAPAGEFRICTAPPIREDRSYSCIELFKNRNGDYVFDFGQNMSGYVSLYVDQPKGTRLHLVFAEELDADGSRKNNTLANHYRTETQFAEIVAGDEPFNWQPDFSYTGFRFVIVSGAVEALNPDDMVGIFVHQDMRLLSDFHCSNKTFEKLFRLSRISTLSNLFYMPTDCPTREKLGWCNDAAASAEQMIQNMDMTAFYDKWMQDILDAMLPDGDLPGIVPTGGWGYKWGSGPISTSILFEVPYRLYQYNGDNTQLKRCYPTMRKHLEFLEGKRDPETGLYAHGLCDWAGPFKTNHVPVPLEFTCTALLIKFYRIAAMAAEAVGDTDGARAMVEAEASATAAFKKAYMLADGRCAYEEQCAISMVVTLGLYSDLSIMREQLLNSIRNHDDHLYLGMLGIQFLLPACDICGLQEEGYALLNATGYPSYSGMFDNDATTLYETFSGTSSQNHHMYSCVIAWFHNTILGIQQTEKLALERTITLKPYFPKDMTYANGSFDTIAGLFRVDWQRNENGISMYVDIPDGVDATLELNGYATAGGSSTIRLSTGRNDLDLLPFNTMKKKKIINIINFVRGEDPRNTQEELYDTFKNQVELCRSYDMPYTFLFQYDAMVKPEYAALVKDNPDPNCELGVWIELAQEQVEKCGIEWRGRPGFKWDWHVNPGFLMAYPLEQRKALIDELFGRFREIFGFYPKSVGSWLLDTYSIQYMTDAYGVDAFCVCKDQHGTDGYTLWGGYYNQAYYPSKHNMFVPAQHAENQINAPVFRMLGSDPIYQYDCSADEHYNPALLQHVYSLEPVWPTGKDPKWVDWYLHNNFEEECITWAYTQAGQENPFRWKNFGEGLTMQMAKFWEGVQAGRFEVMTLGDTGRWFKETYKATPASAVTCMDDWKGEGRQAFWYNCKNYRTSFYTAEGRVCIRDMFLFDETYPERYWDEVATGTSATYDAQPMIDGYRWSGNDIFCGVDFVYPGKTDMLKGDIKRVWSENDTDLKADLEIAGRPITVHCEEHAVTLTGVAGLELLLRWNTTEETSIEIEANRLIYNHNGMKYAMTIQGANLVALENGVRFMISEDYIVIKPEKL